MYGIFTYIWLMFMVNVGKYTSLMDPYGTILLFHVSTHSAVLDPEKKSLKTFFPY